MLGTIAGILLYGFAALQTDELMTAKRPKTDDTDDNPAAKKRNRRMFGFLNQTLQKSK